MHVCMYLSTIAAVPECAGPPASPAYRIFIIFFVTTWQRPEVTISFRIVDMSHSTITTHHPYLLANFSMVSNPWLRCFLSPFKYGPVVQTYCTYHDPGLITPPLVFNYRIAASQSSSRQNKVHTVVLSEFTGTTQYLQYKTSRSTTYDTRPRLIYLIVASCTSPPLPPHDSLPRASQVAQLLPRL